MKNSQGLTLTYVIRKTPDPSDIVIDREQEVIKNYPLQGNLFSHDTKMVLVIIKKLTVDTDYETWTKGKCCDQEAMLALQNNYDDKSYSKHRK